MRLKSLEIKGFKSFADKTRVLLDHAVTGVVGPNGCGKSNIVDAIRWVIGEHKIKSLRSDNLDDLIFNGSKTRPAASMAEVSLTFENTRNLLPTEFSTVTITRRFYKSGESEYRLNDVNCRLKDIHNLFMDTGVSSDSYAIIELGMVDDIIKDKDGSRRRMLEQAAGISIYKTRKKEAKSKLEGTQSDISRIDDLLFEINNNLRTLESQARKAERYLQVKNDYKAVSMELAKASLASYNDKYQSLNTQLAAEQDKKLKIEAEISGDEAEIEANKLLLIQKEQALSRSQRQFNDLENRIRALESEKKLAAQHLTHLEERAHQLKKLVEQAAEQLQLLQQAINQLTQQLNADVEVEGQLKEELQSLRSGLDDKREAFDVQKQELDARRKKLQEVQLSQFEHEKKVAVADTSLASLQRSIFQLETEISQRNDQINDLKRQFEAANLQQIDKKEALEQIIKKQKAIQQQLADETEVQERLNESAVAYNRKLDARRNEYDLLKSLVDNLEGYPDSIKFLKRQAQWNEDAPLLSDIFIVQDEYKTALETVLEPYLNYYVVKDLAAAAAAARLLEEHKKGKANFFLLDQLNRVEDPALPDLDPDSGLRAALDVVDVPAAFRTLAHHLLGKVFITTDDDILQTELVGDVVVAKSGKILRGKYSLSGGSTGLFTGNKIGRARNLEKLRSEVEVLVSEAAGLQQKVAASRQTIGMLRQRLKENDPEPLRLEWNRANNEAINLQGRIEHFEQQQVRNNERLADLQQQLDDHRDVSTETNEQLSEISVQTAKLKAALQQAEEAFTAVEHDYNLVNQQFNRQNIELTKQQSKVEGIRQELTFRNNQLVTLQNQDAANKLQLKETAAKISETSGRLHFGDNELYDLLEQKEKDERALNSEDRAYHAFRNALNEHEQKISRQRKEKEQAETLLNAFREKLTEMKLQVTSIKERLNVEFNVELETLLDDPRDTEKSQEALEEEAERLKRKLENIGEVNPTAIEAYQEVKLRYDFIMEQKRDLEDARDTLLATIDEVERTANARFKETFDQVSINFEQVFKALFTEEDKASLKLTDPDQLADSGIEIYAQPKGKRPSTLTQLSGGEKTLTSTAFLFAIYLIKPAPFCILDEVDAPLDDANVGKFTGMIRKFSDKSQFIIVTHNKQTMASVDVIYGVTMQEAGISKLVPVDFRNLD